MLGRNCTASGGNKAGRLGHKIEVLYFVGDDFNLGDNAMLFREWGQENQEIPQWPEPDRGLGRSCDAAACLLIDLRSREQETKKANVQFQAWLQDRDMPLDTKRARTVHEARTSECRANYRVEDIALRWSSILRD